MSPAQLLLGDAPAQKPVSYHERHVDSLMGAALRRVDDELGVFDEVAGVSVLDTATDLLDFVHADHPALPPSYHQL